MADILLIYPPVLHVPVNKVSERLYHLLDAYCKKIDFFGLASNVNSLVPPIALLSIATYLLKNGYSVSVLDMILEEREGKNPFVVLNKILKKENPRVVGISEMEMCLKTISVEIAKIVKKYDPQIVTVMGGVNASAEADELLQNNELDAIVHSEGEKTFLELCNRVFTDKSLEDIDGISYRTKNGSVIKNPPRLFLSPEEIPIPSRDIYPFKRLYKLNNNLDLVYASRGCPHNCSFCNAPLFWKHRWRGRLIKDIIEELKLIEDKGGKKIHIWDINFGTNKKWINRLCENIKNERIEIKWDCELRIDDLKTEFLKSISSAGCCGAYCGIESADQPILDAANKGYSLDILKKSLKRSITNGVIVEGGYVIGLPQDNKFSIVKTNKLAIKLFEEDLAIPHHFLFIPFKGTEIGENPNRYGIKIVNSNSTHFHFIPPKSIASTKFLSAEEVYNLWVKGQEDLVEVAEEKLGL